MLLLSLSPPKARGCLWGQAGAQDVPGGAGGAEREQPAGRIEQRGGGEVLLGELVWG